MFLPSIESAVIVLTAWLPLIYEYCVLQIQLVLQCLDLGIRCFIWTCFRCTLLFEIFILKNVIVQVLLLLIKKNESFSYIHTQLNMYYVQLGKYIKMCFMIYIMCEFSIGSQPFRISFTFETGPVCSGCALSVIF